MNSGLLENNVTYKKFIDKSYIYIYIFLNKIWYQITYKGWYAIKHKQLSGIIYETVVNFFV